MRAVCILTLCAVLLAGCGTALSAADKAYVGRINVMQDHFAQRARAIQSTLSAATATPAEQARALDALDAAVRRAAADVRAAQPAKHVADLNASLLAAIERYGPVIAARRGAITASAQEQLAANARFATAAQAVNNRIGAVIGQIRRRLS